MTDPVRWLLIAPCSRTELAAAFRALFDEDELDEAEVAAFALELHDGNDGHAAAYCRSAQQAWGGEVWAERLSSRIPGTVIALELDDENGPVLARCRGGACEFDYEPAVAPSRLVSEHGLPAVSEPYEAPPAPAQPPPSRAACVVEAVGPAEVLEALRRSYGAAFDPSAVQLAGGPRGTTVLAGAPYYRYVGSDLSEQLPDATVYAPIQYDDGVSIYRCRGGDFEAVWRDAGVGAKDYDPPLVLDEIAGARTLPEILAALSIPPAFVR